MTMGSVRPTRTARRSGYAIAVIVNAAVLYGANVWPGWQVLPFLTADMALVMGLVNASILTSLAANLVYLASDTPFVKALGDVVTTATALAAAVRMWQVFPFDFGTASFDWALLVRVALVAGMIAGAIQIIVALVSLLRSLRNRADSP